jgi:hypothetical protein
LVLAFRLRRSAVADPGHAAIIAELPHIGKD